MAISVAICLHLAASFDLFAPLALGSLQLQPELPAPMVDAAAATAAAAAAAATSLRVCTRRCTGHVGGGAAHQAAT